MGWTTGVQFPAGATASRLALGSTQLPIHCIQGVKWQGREAENSYPSSADVKNAWSYTSTHSYFFHGVVLN